MPDAAGLVDAARAAEAQLSHVIDENPEKLSEAFAAAVRRLVRLRDGLIERRRRGEAAPAGWLERVNGIMSLLIAAEYPLQGFHWDQICQARDALRALLGEA